MRSFLSLAFLVFLMVGLASGCTKQTGDNSRSADLADRPVRIVATTSMLADLVREVGGDRVEVTGLMGPGVDPHLYKASEGDVRSMSRADLVVYNGLHLEGRMTELFEQMQGRSIPTFAVAEALPESDWLSSEYFTGSYDPHIWFDVALWSKAAGAVGTRLAALDPAHADQYQAQTATYQAQLDSLDAQVRAQLEAVPAERRVLITSHDAFGYFGRAYGFDVLGLQGISTATEAGTADVQNLASVIAEREIPALFVESSISPRGIEAVQAAVRSRGHEVVIGGSLYSDALGSPGTPEATFIGTVRHNVRTIAGALGTVPVATAAP